MYIELDINSVIMTHENIDTIKTDTEKINWKRRSLISSSQLLKSVNSGQFDLVMFLIFPILH
jgi:hypothetical protein